MTSEPTDPSPELAAQQFAAFIQWMEDIEQQVPHDVPAQTHWRCLARILTLVTGGEQVDWRELRDDRERVLRAAFTRPGERATSGPTADVLRP